jgi:thiol-disulfide isomerase/thioredoxin
MTKKAQLINKPIIFILLLLVVIGSIWYLESQKAMPVSLAFDDSEEIADEGVLDEQVESDLVTEDLEGNLEKIKQEKELIIFTPNPEKEGKYKRAPELVGTQKWVNSDPLKEKDLIGNVVLIDFWTYSCINCIRTLPFLKEWHEKYSDKGLVIIGVHTPEFKFEEDYDNLVESVKKRGLKYPIVQDNNYATWRAFKNRFWPRKYLIDAEGYIRFDHIGEGAYKKTEMKIQELLEERGIDVSNIDVSDLNEKVFAVARTPELYAGYEFALPRDQNIGNLLGLVPNITKDYSLPENLKADKIYLEGKWKSNSENLQAKDNEQSSIILMFTAMSVNIVADTLKEPLELEVKIGEKYITKEQAGKDVQFKDEKAFIVVDEPRLYNVVNGIYGMYKLKLATKSNDFTFNTFTFG